MNFFQIISLCKGHDDMKGRSGTFRHTPETNTPGMIPTLSTTLDEGRDQTIGKREKINQDTKDFNNKEVISEA